MIDTLNSYFVQNRSISIPGLGTIHIDRYPARVDAASGQLLPPVYAYRFDKFHDTPVKDFFLFLADRERIPEYEAIKQYNEFAAAFRADIRQKSEATWKNIGVFKQDDSGEIVFEQHNQPVHLLTPVKAVTVPQEETVTETPVSTEQEVLEDIPEYRESHEVTDEGRKDTWWIYALVLFALALAFLWFHFYTSGMNRPAFFYQPPVL